MTIIILLILAGISIASLTGNGLFKKAKLAKERQNEAEIEENTILDGYVDKMDSYIGNTRNEKNSRIETIIWDTDVGYGDVVTFLNNKTIDEFDEIAFLTRATWNTWIDRCQEIRVLTSSYNYFKMNSPSNNEDNAQLSLYGFDDSRILLYNLTSTGFKIGKCTRMRIMRIIGIKY